MRSFNKRVFFKGENGQYCAITTCIIQKVGMFEQTTLIGEDTDENIVCSEYLTPIEKIWFSGHDRLQIISFLLGGCNTLARFLHSDHV